jgi:hypothetical protein
MKKYEKYIVENDEFVYDEGGSGKVGNSLSKQDNELFNDDDNKPYTTISVKRIVDKNSSEDWYIFNSDKTKTEPTLIIKGSRFTSKEKEFLRSAQGMIFLIDGFKSGWRSISEFKRNVVSVAGEK